MKKKIDKKKDWLNKYSKSKFRNYSFDSASGKEVEPLYSDDNSNELIGRISINASIDNEGDGKPD